MAYDGNKEKLNLHRYLQGYKGQALSYEIVKDLMSFVFDMVKDPGVSWVSQDSHIRLLNGIFKKVGQTLDDKTIDGIEESVCSAFVFRSQPEMPNIIGKLLRQGKTGEAPAKPTQASQPDSAAVPVPGPKDNAAGASGNETLFRRLHMELVTFESRIAKMAEAASQESHEAAKRMTLERIELESRLAIDREELSSIFSKERAEYRACLEKEHDELKDMLSSFLSEQEEGSKQAEHSLDERMHDLESVTETTKGSIETLLNEHAKKHDAGLQKTESLLDARLKSMEQKLHETEEKVSAGRRALKRMNVAVMIGLIVMIAGFGAVIYSLNVHP